MEVFKHEDGRLTLKITPEEGETFFDLIQSDEFFFADLEFYVVDEWSYIYDRGRDLVYWLDGYTYNLVRDLEEEGEVTLDPHENDPEVYEEYPWNEVYSNQG